MLPLAAGAIRLRRRKLSRACGLERWTSITGVEIALTASSRATELWVKPAALRITAFAPFGLRLVQPVDQMAFVVGLADLDLDPELPRPVLEPAGNLVERVGAVDFRLAGAEQVEVGAVQHIDDGWRGHGEAL